MNGIYKITNLVNEKVYIGQSKQKEKRWYAHQWHYNKGDRSQTLYIAMQKYKPESFKFEVIKECDRGDLDTFERFFIRVYCSWHHEYGYNRTLGGQKMTFGYKKTIEQRRRLSEIAKGLIWWNNGKKQTKAKNCPGEGWTLGYLISDNERKKRGERIRYCRQFANLKAPKPYLHEMRWFNDGIKNVRRKECPEGFVLGKLSAGKFWNDGKEQVFSKECPEGFIAGMLKEKTRWAKGKQKMYHDPLTCEHKYYVEGQQLIGWLLGYGINFKPRAA
jgi:hypothetical protein